MMEPYVKPFTLQPLQISSNVPVMAKTELISDEVKKEIYNATIRAMKDYEAAKERLQKAEERVFLARNAPGWVREVPEFRKSAAEELTEAKSALENLGKTVV